MRDEHDVNESANKDENGEVGNPRREKAFSKYWRNKFSSLLYLSSPLPAWSKEEIGKEAVGNVFYIYTSAYEV